MFSEGLFQDNLSLLYKPSRTKDMTELSKGKIRKKYTVNGLRLQANVASALFTQIELDCSTGLILNVNM